MNNRTILKYHSLAGLIAGIFLVIMGISGAILVFQHDIEDAQWDTYISVQDAEGLNIDKGIRTIQETYPSWDTRLIHFKADEALVFNLRRPPERVFVFVHPTTGKIIKELNELTTFTRWLLKFHYSFQAGPVGKILVFVMGFLFLFSLLTGFYLYRRSIINTLLFRTKFVTRSRRGLYSSLHRVVGVWSLIFNLLLVVTGLFLSWLVVHAEFNPAAPPATPEVTASTEDLLEQIAVAYPDYTPTYIRLPYSAADGIRVNGLFDDDPFYYSEYYNNIIGDYHTGKITGVYRIQEADLKTRLTSTLIPLHFGQYGGIWSKLLYCFIGLSGPLLSISGYVIWRTGKVSLSKKSKKSPIKN